MSNICTKQGHSYTRNSDVVRRCVSCSKMQWRVSGVWVDHREPTRKRQTESDPNQLMLFK